MKKFFISLMLLSVALVLTNCEKSDNTPAIADIDYVSFESSFLIGVDPTGTANSEVKVAVSKASNTDRTFNLSVVDDMTTADPSAYSIPSSVIIPANTTVGTFTVNVVGENVGASGDDILTIEIASQDEGLFKSDPISLNLKQVCPYPETILDITFDGYPEEIYWALYDSNDNLLFESAPGAYGAYAGFTGSTTKSFCLSQGSYTFVIYDSYGDGAGPFSITYDGNVLFSSNGAYGSGGSIPLTIN